MKRIPKAKDPVQEHRASTEILQCSRIRLRNEPAYSITARLSRVSAFRVGVCPICSRRYVRAIQMLLAIEGGVLRADMCLQCYRIAISSIANREMASNRLAQLKPYQGICHE